MHALMRHALIRHALIRRVPACLLLLFIASAAHAQGTVIYRCTDAKGAVTMQNDKPCGPGMQQSVRTVGALPTAPAPVRREAAPPPAPPPIAGNFELVMGPQVAELPPSAIPLSDRAPPPALFQCKTWEEDDYFSETGEPEPVCVPLTTIGIGGNTNLGVGEACEMRQDVCTEMTAEALCQAWHRRVDEAQFRFKFARDGETAMRKAEYDRVAKLLADSNCR
jgi:hypothetical protein